MLLDCMQLLVLQSNKFEDYMKEYEIVPHTADLKIRAYGITLEELYRNALKGMFASIKPKSTELRYKDDEVVVLHFNTERHVVVRSLNQELLLADFLSECIYVSDVHDEAYFDAQFKQLSETELDALVYGVKIHGFEALEIKAVTYNELVLEQIDGLWCATIVFDI